MKRRLPNAQAAPASRSRMQAPSLEFLRTSDEAAGLPVGAIVWVGDVAYHKRAISHEWAPYPEDAAIYHREKKRDIQAVQSVEDVI